MDTRKYSFTSLGLDLEFSGPSSAADIERLLKEPGICERMFMTQYAYNDRGPAFREAYAAAVETFTGVQRKTKTVGEGDKAKVVFDETEQEYLNRVTLPAAEGVPAALSEEDRLRIGIEVNAELGDWSPSLVSGKKPAAQFYEKADALLAKIGAKATTVETVIANIEAKLGVSFDASFGEWNRDNAARAIKALHEQALKAVADLG